MSDSLESRRIRANDARQLLQNPILRDAFNEAAEYLEQQALSCDPDNKDKAQRIIISKRLLADIKRAIERQIEDGDVAGFQMAEIEKRRGLVRLFQR